MKFNAIASKQQKGQAREQVSLTSQVCLKPQLESDTAFDRSALLGRHYPIVQSVVNSMRYSLPTYADLEELHSVGVTGLVAAVKRYDPSQLNTFEGYVALRVRGAILDELRRMDWMPRTVRSKTRKLKHACDTLEQRLGRSPTEIELQQELGMSSDQFRQLRAKSNPIHFISLDAPTTSENETECNLHEAISDETQNHLIENVEKKELAKLVFEKIQTLPTRQKQVLAMYYHENMRLSEIATAFGVTEARICQIHTQAISTLRKYCLSIN